MKIIGGIIHDACPKCSGTIFTGYKGNSQRFKCLACKAIGYLREVAK